MITGEEDLSYPFLSRIGSSGRKRGLDNGQVASSVLIAVASTAAIYSKAITHIVDFFLQEGQEKNLRAFKAVLQPFADNVCEESRQKVMVFVREALREYDLLEGFLILYLNVYCHRFKFRIESFGKFLCPLCVFLK